MQDVTVIKNSKNVQALIENLIVGNIVNLIQNLKKHEEYLKIGVENSIQRLMQ